MFRVQPSSLYLLKEFQNVAIFPHEKSERFNRSQFDSRYSYEVHGDEVVVPGTPTQPDVPKPSGAYTGPSHDGTLSSASLPSRAIVNTPFSATGQKRKTLRKTIALVSLSEDCERPSSSRSSGVSYTVITQVVATLECNECTSSIVSDLVKQQVGYDVVLLDSKCYLILDDDTSQGVEFWKSSHKILAASKSVYTSMKGSSADPKRTKVQIDLTSELEGSTEPKRGCSLDPAQKDNRSILKWLEKIEGTLGNLEAIQAVVCNIDSRLTFVTSILETFQCVICRSLAKKPVMAPCCHRVVGCVLLCVLQCVRDNSTCQHCSSEATPSCSLC